MMLALQSVSQYLHQSSGTAERIIIAKVKNYSITESNIQHKEHMFRARLFQETNHSNTPKPKTVVSKMKINLS